MKIGQLCSGGVRLRLLSNRISFVIFGCLLIAVFISINFYMFKDYLHSPMFTPPDKINYHDPDDTNSGECLKNYFEDVLLIIVYHFPFYDSIPLLKSFYGDVFKNILICGPESYFYSFVMVVEVGPGLYGYECAGEAIRRYPGYRGYLYINDDMVVNWWTFSNLDKEKFWQSGILTSVLRSSGPDNYEFPGFTRLVGKTLRIVLAGQVWLD
ncbi:uncharacterized protein LOC114526267 isoform X2 [Dendronephthya gigantea]|uniref:uncharacterized protein LOC114526267 isoform X2 n=1 Tax=Dendronephthya gigantea TaxID=151771 RepID=UPI00106CEA1F|nr:uncharacterized protein LOC114526267 isoform X2 [Dendronephthya gigantea]